VNDTTITVLRLTQVDRAEVGIMLMPVHGVLLAGPHAGVHARDELGQVRREQLPDRAGETRILFLAGSGTGYARWSLSGGRPSGRDCESTLSFSSPTR
jgi:hypothetical protein